MCARFAQDQIGRRADGPVLPPQIMQEARDLIALNDGVIMSQPTRHRCTHPRGTEGVRTPQPRIIRFLSKG